MLPPYSLCSQGDNDKTIIFQSLTSGVNLQEQQAKLEGLKQESYFQRKKAKTEEEKEEEKREEKEGKKKKWINLDAAGFEDFDGTISGEEEEVAKPGKKMCAVIVTTNTLFYSFFPSLKTLF